MILTLVSNFIPGSRGGSLDLLSLIGALYLLQGSQAWLRYLTFVTVTGTLMMVITSLIAGLVIATGFESQLEGGGLSFDFDPQDWKTTVQDFGLGVFMASACILTLRTRHLNYWTLFSKRMSILGACVFGLTVLISAGSLLSRIQTERTNRMTFKVELDAARERLAGRLPPEEAATIIGANQSIRLVYWTPDPVSYSASPVNVIFNRDEGGGVRWKGKRLVNLPCSDACGTKGALWIYPVDSTDPP